MRASSGCLFGILIWKKRKEMFFKIIFCKKIFGRRRPRHYLSTTQSKPTELETSLVANGYQTSRLGSFNVALKRAETRMIVHPGRIGERFVNEANMRKKKKTDEPSFARCNNKKSVISKSLRLFASF